MIEAYKHPIVKKPNKFSLGNGWYTYENHCIDLGMLIGTNSKHTGNYEWVNRVNDDSSKNIWLQLDIDYGKPSSKKTYFKINWNFSIKIHKTSWYWYFKDLNIHIEVFDVNSKIESTQSWNLYSKIFLF